MHGLRNRHLFALDLCLLPLAAYVACELRFEGAGWPPGAARVLLTYFVLALPVKLAVMRWLGLYGRLWRYASVTDLRVMAAALVGGAAAAAAAGGFGTLLLVGASPMRVPFSIIALDALLGAVAAAAPRLATRAYVARHPMRVPATARERRVVIAGAGAAGALIARELLHGPALHRTPVAFVDDDPHKLGRTLHGVLVAGRLEHLEAVAARFGAEEVIVAMPSVPGPVIRCVMQRATDAGLRTRTVPGLYELIEGHKSVSALRDIRIEDLLRREPVSTDLDRVRTLAHGKTVLVTGAGGSIGSELCRQIARLRPDRLIVVGRGENSIFELVQELTAADPQLRVEPVIADVRDRARLERVFRTRRPETVFHAAAHKHVPLMEQNVSEAILNNVLGTQVVGELAARYGGERFVLISSDKAVRPSSVMGATKRLAEGVVQALSARSRCRFMSVRFGNVLGSRGSVIPTFLSQIRRGGPITITHPEMRRYFMTIPEAVQLVLQAGAMGSGGEVFVLDMGEPVRVLDLARDLVRLSGLVEGEDVEIRFTGMRPGEKLYEELFFNHENASPTEHPKVLRARNALLDLSGSMSLDQLYSLAAHDAPSDDLRRGIKALVPEYTGIQPVGPVSPAAPDGERWRERAARERTATPDFGFEVGAGADATVASVPDDLTSAGVRGDEWGGAGLPSRNAAVRPAP